MPCGIIALVKSWRHLPPCDFFVEPFLKPKARLRIAPDVLHQIYSWHIQVQRTSTIGLLEKLRSRKAKHSLRQLTKVTQTAASFTSPLLPEPANDIRNSHHAAYALSRIV